MKATISAVLAIFILATAADAAPASTTITLPAAITADPAPDRSHPASNLAVQFESHGTLLNGVVLRPSGADAHRTIVLFHGLPGNEQGLDIAQTLRRAGWAVITFHYSGSWGSGGRFGIRQGVEDAGALVKTLSRPDIAATWGVDPQRLVFIGHSYGGFVAAAAAAHTPGLKGVALLAPWDPSMGYRQWRTLDHAAAMKAGTEAFDDVDGRLGSTTHETLTEEVLRDGAGFELGKTASALAMRPVLIVTASRDSKDDKAESLLQSLRALHAANVSTKMMQTDHAFSDHRIALQAEILRWVEGLGIQ